MPLAELSLVGRQDREHQPIPGGPVKAVTSREQMLIGKALEGDTQAFAELYRLHRRAVLDTCFHRLRDHQLAEDAAQDTFVSAYANLREFDLSRSLLTWLQSIAIKRCIDLGRRASKTTVTDEVESRCLEDLEPDPTLRAVLASDERRRLERALRRIAPRQRRALLLHVVEGWSYTEIAEAEGISVASTKSLLFHARDSLKRACRRGLLAGLVMPLASLRRRVTNLSRAVRVRARLASEPLVATSAGSLGQTVAALAVALVALTPQGIPASFRTIAQGGAPAGAPADSVGTSGSGASNVRASVLPERSADGGGMVAGILHPTRNARPEDTQFTSIAPSPNYEQDHTLYASGRVRCPQTSCMVLFVSHTGGATWTALPSNRFRGYSVILPPGYPSDPRIFAMSYSGLQRSDDGGKNFRVVVPLQGDAAISPLFGAQDPRILIGATVVTEYWANSDVAEPATLVGPVGTWLTVAFSPDYAADSTLFVGGVRPDGSGILRPTVNRCTASICANVMLHADSDAPWIRPSPRFDRDSTVYAFTPHAFFRSTDGAQTFASSMPAFNVRGLTRDLLVAPNGTLYASVENPSGLENGVYRSFDGGATWVGGKIRLRGFEQGASHVSALADGRLIALGASSGLACSEDGGRTWASRCAQAA